MTYLGARCCEWLSKDTARRCGESEGRWGQGRRRQREWSATANTGIKNQSREVCARPPCHSSHFL